MSWLMLFSGIVIIAGGMIGFYEGVRHVKVGQIYTWVTMVGAVYLTFFGLVPIAMVAFARGDAAQYVYRQFKFLDTFAGRGGFLIFCGLHVVPLSKVFCLIGGAIVMLFGVLNIFVHFILLAPPRRVVQILNLSCIVVGTFVVSAGCIGMYYALPVVRLWPPITWNNAFNAVFCIVFGLAILFMSLRDENDTRHAYVIRYIGFLDTIAGRGVLIIFVALRVMTLAQLYCFVGGLVLFFFGVLLVAVHCVLGIDSISEATIDPVLAIGIDKLTDSQKASLNNIFRNIDVDRSGFLSTEEVFEVGLIIYPKFTKEASEGLIRRFDQRNDGKLNALEFLCFFGDVIPAVPPAVREAGLAQLLATTRTISPRKMRSQEFPQEPKQKTVLDRCQIA